MADGEYLGEIRYVADMEGEYGRLFVAVPCHLDGISEPVFALLDTASEWCMMPAEVAADLGYDLTVRGNLRIHTRFGLISGWLETIPVEFRADGWSTPANAENILRVEATWFISEEWIGPSVIGWKGCLERMRFGVDPGQDLFYFATPGAATARRRSTSRSR